MTSIDPTKVLYLRQDDVRSIWENCRAQNSVGAAVQMDPTAPFCVLFSRVVKLLNYGQDVVNSPVMLGLECYGFGLSPKHPL